MHILRHAYLTTCISYDMHILRHAFLATCISYDMHFLRSLHLIADQLQLVHSQTQSKIVPPESVGFQYHDLFSGCVWDVHFRWLCLDHIKHVHLIRPCVCVLLGFWTYTISEIIGRYDIGRPDDPGTHTHLALAFDRTMFLVSLG